MNTRQNAPWGWILGALALVLVAGAAGYWLGAHHGVMFERPFHVGGGFGGFGGFSLLGLVLLALLVAVVVGLIVAAMTREPASPETYEEWHRRAHAQAAMGTTAEPTLGGPAPVAPPPPRSAAPADDESVT